MKLFENLVPGDVIAQLVGLLEVMDAEPGPPKERN